MEETKETKETKEPKLSYEQLEQAAMQLQQRLVMAESKLRGIDFATMRLTWLFKVLENKELLSPAFVEKAAKEIENLLTLDEETDEETEVEADKA